MKKAFDQTVRDLKREVNKKVLKVPSIEQKVLDATSNESWGPHGSVLADIAQATRNYHEYQMVMSVIWKRINDTGKNWRHVYKALIVLDYLVAHGSERVIDDIREHAYQISTLSDFQYIDSSGRDQGNNVRKKSQSLVALVNDKERIQEVRQKAVANRDKFRSSHTGSTYHSSSRHGDRYDDYTYEGRYRDNEKNGNGKERDWGSRDENRYGRYGDSYSRDGDRYNGDAEDRYGRESYQDDDYRGRSRSVDDYHHGSRVRSADSYRSVIEEDGQYSSRGSGVKADNHPQDRSSIDKKLNRKYSGKSTEAPPSFEDDVGSAQSPGYSERDGESTVPSVPKAFSVDPSHGVASAAPPALPSALGNPSGPAPTLESPPEPTTFATQPGKNEVDAEEFDPRSVLSAAPAPSNVAPTVLSGVEKDLLGSLGAYSASSLALVPAGQPTTREANRATNLTSDTSVSNLQPSSTFNNQSFDDPFGDGPFKAVPPSETVLGQQHTPASSTSFVISSSNAAPPNLQWSPIEIGGPSYDATYIPSGPSGVSVPSFTQLVHQELTSPSLEVDILADILPLAPVLPEAQADYPSTGFSPEVNQPLSQSAPVMPQNGPQNGFQTQTLLSGGFPAQLGQPSRQSSHALMSAQPMPNTGFANQATGFTYPGQTGHYSQMPFPSQGVVPQTSQMRFPQAGSLQPGLANPKIYGAYSPHLLSTIQSTAYAAPPSSTGLAIPTNFLAQTGSRVPVASQIVQQVPQSQTGSLTSHSSVNSSFIGGAGVFTRPSEDKFKTKSSVWVDTLSRGLVNLNISGPKANPLADIGVDFDAINRREKRMEKPSTTSVTSTVTMGKAMGTGSGIGRAGAGSLLPPPNPMLGSSMNIGMAGGMGLGGFGTSQLIGRGMPLNTNMHGNMGLGMNVGMGPGMNMQQPVRFPQGTALRGLGGVGNYAQAQSPYGYR